MSIQRRRGAAQRGRGAAAGTTHPATTVFPSPDTPSAKTAPVPQPSTKLYSIAGLLRARAFTGEFNARGTAYQFTYAPTTASINNHKVELTGRLSVRGPRGAMRSADHVRATLLATQGGVFAALTRRQLLPTTTGVGNVTTPDQQQEQMKAPETTPQPAVPPVNPPLSVAEWTGPLSFVGAMYFRLQPLDGAALGIPLDLSSVQLNTRLAPDSALERDLQFLYSDLIEAVYGERPDERRASAYVKELKSVLKG